MMLGRGLVWWTRAWVSGCMNEWALALVRWADAVRPGGDDDEDIEVVPIPDAAEEFLEGLRDDLHPPTETCTRDDCRLCWVAQQ